MSYADILEAKYFADMHNSYFWRESVQARRDEDTRDLANAIADDVVADGPSKHRAAWVEEVIDDGIDSLLRDLLDDLKAGTDPSATLRKRIGDWAIGVAEYQIERGEHD